MRRKYESARIKPDWSAIFARLDDAGVPDNFLADRDQDPPQDRGVLIDFSAPEDCG